MNNGNHTQIISNLEELLAYWPFLLEGHTVLNEKYSKNHVLLEPEAFFKHLLFLVANGEEEGVIMLLLSKNDKPLGYMVINNTTYMYQEKTALIYAIYSNELCRSTVRELAHFATMWGRARGYAKVHACSFTFSGNARRWFQKWLGFTPRCIVYEKDVNEHARYLPKTVPAVS